MKKEIIQDIIYQVIIILIASLALIGAITIINPH